MKLLQLGSVWEKFELHLSPICLLELIYQFLFLIYGYLFFRYLEKFSKHERNENKEGNSRGVTTSYLPQKEDRKVKDHDYSFLALTLYLLARTTLTIISSPAITGCFKIVNFQGFNLDT